jgi:hypothetical protein
VLRTHEVFPQSAVDLAGACGYWSVKDILAHLASYELVLTDVLSGFVGHDPTPYLDKFTGEGGATFSDDEVNWRKEMTLRQVLAEFEDAHQRAIALAETLPTTPYLFITLRGLYHRL